MLQSGDIEKKNLIVRVQNKLKNNLFIVNIPLLVPKKHLKKRHSSSLKKHRKFTMLAKCVEALKISVLHMGNRSQR